MGVRASRKNNRPLLIVLAAVSVVAIAVVSAQQITRSPLSTGVAPAGPPQKYEPFKELPPATVGGGAQLLPPGGETRKSEVHPGTVGRPLPAPPTRERVRLAILGPLEPARPDGLAKVVGELSEVSPDLVLTTGDLVYGFADSAETYAADAAASRSALNKLTIPWYPCVGAREVLPGTFDPEDQRIAPLYAQYFGPRYYSLDIADTHAIILDSEENPSGPAIFSDDQLAWLRKDLDRTFRRARHVIAVVHRPAWRDKASNWAQVHAAFVAFNHRPIVQIEGSGGPGNIGAGQVEAVFAGGESYTQDTPRDGIRVYVVGPATRGGASASAGQMPQYVMVDTNGGGPTSPRVSVVEIGHVFPGNLVTPESRAQFTKLSAPETFTIEGWLDQPAEGETATNAQEESKVILAASNPTDVPIEVRPRLAANATGWELVADTPTLRLSPGQTLRRNLVLHSTRQDRAVPPPELEICVQVPADSAATRELILRRSVPLRPAAAVLQFPKITAATWDLLPAHNLWNDQPQDAGETRPIEPAAKFRMLADANRFYLRVLVDGVRGVYLPKTDTPWALPMDAVTVAWTDGRTENPAVQRVVVLPFAPPGQQLLTNTGVGLKQTPLTLLDIKACPAVFRVTLLPGGYELELSIPRDVVARDGKSAVINVGAFLAQRGRERTFASWAREDAGPAAWGTVTLVDPATTRAATAPAAPASRP